MFRWRGGYRHRWDILPQTAILLSSERDTLSHFKLFYYPQGQEFDQNGAGKFICRTYERLPVSVQTLMPASKFFISLSLVKFALFFAVVNQL